MTANQSFCNKCGTRAVAAACINCNAAISPGAAFCSTCGEPTKRSAIRDICPTCGAATVGKAVYCIHCGSPIASGESRETGLRPAPEPRPVAASTSIAPVGSHRWGLIAAIVFVVALVVGAGGWLIISQIRAGQETVAAENANAPNEGEEQQATTPAPPETTKAPTTQRPTTVVSTTTVTTSADPVHRRVVQVADDLDRTGFHLDDGVSIDANRAAELLASAHSFGSQFYLVVVSDTPFGGNTAFAETMFDALALNSGTVLVLSPDDVGWITDNDGLTAGDLETAFEEANNRGGDDATYVDTFLTSLFGETI